MQGHAGFILHRLLGSVLTRVPQLDDLRVGCTPSIFDRVKLVLCQAHVQRAHCLQCTGTALIPECELRDLALLAIRRFLSDAARWQVKHLLGRGFVDFAVRVEHIEAPLTPSQPSDHTRLNGAEVDDDEPTPFACNERGPDEL